jgi:hypothetical protein
MGAFKMKKISIIPFALILVLAVFLAGCTQEVVCDKPYIKVGTECCLDQNENNICDSDESNTKTNTPPEKSTESNLNQNTLTDTEILSYKITFKEGSSSKYSQYKVVGEIQNNKEAIDYPKIYFTGYDSSNGIVCTEYVYAEYKPLNKGESSPFELSFYLDDCPDLETYKIKFETSVEEGNINDVNITSSESTSDSTKTDKCSSMVDWTVSGTEEQQEICYNSKYLQYSITKNNVSICDEIVSEAWLGRCYANFAIEKEDFSICDNTPDRKYTAKGYYEDLSSKDICPYFYMMSLAEKVLSYEKVDVPNKLCEGISNEQLKEDCITKKEAIEEMNESI